MIKIMSKKEYTELLDELDDAENSLAYYKTKTGKLDNEKYELLREMNNLREELNKTKQMELFLNQKLEDKDNLSKCNLELQDKLQKRINKLVGACGGYKSNINKLRKKILKYEDEKNYLREIISKQEKEINKLKHPKPLIAYQNDGLRKNQRERARV